MIVRRIARPMLASVFVTNGIDTLRNPAARVEKAEPVVDLIAESARPVAQKVAAGVAAKTDAAVDVVDELPAGTEPAMAKAHEVKDAVHQVAEGKPLPFETETYVKVNAAVQVGAGLMLAVGKAPRLAATALAASLVPTTFAGHRFWELEGDERKAQQIHFTKNVAMLGGLIIAAADTEGRPGIAYKASHAGKEAKVAAAATKANAAISAKALKANAKAAKHLAAAEVKHAKAGSRKARKARKKAAKAARQEAKLLAAKAALKGSEIGHLIAEKGSELGHAVAERGAGLAHVAAAKGHDLADAVRDSDVPDHVSTRAAELATVAAVRGRDFADAVRESDLPEVVAARAGELSKVAAVRGRELAESARNSELSAEALDRFNEVSARAQQLVASRR